MKHNENYPVTVLCYGDSNTFGFAPQLEGERYGTHQRWTRLLQKKLGSGWDVIEEGLNGRTTIYERPDGFWKSGLPYFVPCLISHKPIDFLVLMLGTNDCNADLHLTERDIAAGMEKLVTLAESTLIEEQGFVPKIVVVAPAAIRPELAGTPYEEQLDEYSVEKSRLLAPLYKELAERRGCLYLDATGIDVLALDCEHLSEQGHKQLAEMLYDTIKG